MFNLKVVLGFFYLLTTALSITLDGLMLPTSVRSALETIHELAEDQKVVRNKNNIGAARRSKRCTDYVSNAYIPHPTSYIKFQKFNLSQLIAAKPNVIESFFFQLYTIISILDSNGALTNPLETFTPIFFLQYYDVYFSSLLMKEYVAEYALLMIPEHVKSGSPSAATWHWIKTVLQSSGPCEYLHNRALAILNTLPADWPLNSSLFAKESVKLIHARHALESMKRFRSLIKMVYYALNFPISPCENPEVRHYLDVLFYILNAELKPLREIAQYGFRVDVDLLLKRIGHAIYLDLAMSFSDTDRPNFSTDLIIFTHTWNHRVYKVRLLLIDFFMRDQVFCS